MWLLPLPLSSEQRVHLPPGRHLFPWHYRPEETAQLTELLTGLLAGVDRNLILPWSAAKALVSPATPVAMGGTLLVVTFDDPPPDDETIDEALARVRCPHVMLQIPRAGERGYAWQERYLKGALMTLIQDHISDEEHPLAPLNIAALPVRRAATFAPDVLGLFELLEATAKHRLSRTAEGTSEAVYEASLWAEVGHRLAERLLRLKPFQVEAALEVLMAEGVGAWSNERFREGAEALHQVGLALVAGGSVSLDPMARRATDRRTLAALREVLSRQLSISLPRRWVVETAFTDEGSSSASSSRRRTSDQIREWIHEGSDFKDRCHRARDFLSDPDRSKRVRTDRHLEYMYIWTEPLRCEFTEGEWERITRARVDEDLYKVLEPNRFRVQVPLTRQVDAFLDRREDLRIDLARWITFAFNENLVGWDRPLILDVLSWIWRSVLENPVDRDDGLQEAQDVLRRCLADALKYGYEREEEHIRADAQTIELDVSGVVAAGERSSEYLQWMRDGFENMLECAFPDARKAYGQAGAFARERGNAFDEWVALCGEREAVLESIDWMDRVTQESQSLIDEYDQRRLVMERAPKVKEWMERARGLQETLVQMAIKGFITQNRRRRVSERAMSWSPYPHDYWSIFRDLETIHAPPALQRTYIRALIDLGGFDPEKELRYRLQLGVNEAETTTGWISRIIDEGCTSLEEQRKRDDALLKELTRGNTRKLERRRRVTFFPAIADILRVDDLDWALSFLSQCEQEIKRDTDSKDDYVGALCRYAALDLRPVALDRLEECARGVLSPRESIELARSLGGELPFEAWVGLHAEAADRLVRLTLDVDRHVAEQVVSMTDKDLAWGLSSVIRGVNRFGRSLATRTREDLQAWSDRLLRKNVPAKRSDLLDAITAGTLLAYLLAPDDTARTNVVREVLARAVKAPMGVWVTLVEAGVSPTSTVMATAAEDLWSKLNETWEERLQFAENNPQHASRHVAFLAEMIRSKIVNPITLAQERLLRLVEAAPEELSLCAEILDPTLWGDRWQPFLEQVWKSAGGVNQRDPVASRLGAVELLHRWVNHASAAELPSELGFLVDMAMLAIFDENPLVANHAAYAIAGYAGRVRAPTEIPRIAGALRRMAVDPRLAVRHAAAYAGRKLSLMDVADEIRAAAQEIDRALAEDPYAIIQRQRAFGELDAKYP